jgi:hypothetical protein
MIQSRKDKELNRIEANNCENARNSNEIFRIDQNQVQLHLKLLALIDYTHLYLLLDLKLLNSL